MNEKHTKITVSIFKNANDIHYKYKESGAYLTVGEVEEVKGKVKFMFGKTAQQKDFDYMNKKWEHKLCQE